MNERSQNSIREMERLFKEQYAFLCLVSFSIIKDKDASKDIVQDFFLSYWQRKETVVVTTSFKAYAVRAVRNLSLLYLEKIKRNKILLQDLDVEVYEEQRIFDKPRILVKCRN